MWNIGLNILFYKEKINSHVWMNKYVSYYYTSNFTLLFLHKNLNADIAINSSYKWILGASLAGFWYISEHDLQIAILQFPHREISSVCNILLQGLEQVHRAMFINTTLKNELANYFKLFYERVSIALALLCAVFKVSVLRRIREILGFNLILCGPFWWSFSRV